MRPTHISNFFCKSDFYQRIVTIFIFFNLILDIFRHFYFIRKKRCFIIRKNNIFILRLKKGMKGINMEQCQFCNNMFATNKTLRHHQMHVKYCLKIQENKTSLVFIFGHHILLLICNHSVFYSRFLSPRAYYRELITQ